MPPVQSVPVTLLDSQGRVRASKEPRRIILAEFERSGVSAARFAKRTGLNYSTFAGWLQRYRRPKPRGPHPKPVRLLEAVMEPTPASGGQSPQALVVALPGGARLEIGDVNKCPWPRRCYGRYTSHAEFFRELERFVAVEACDMRKGFNGLYAAVTERLGEDPKGGALFVFSNRSHTRIKILCWDGTGLWVLTKRLEEGTFAWPKNLEPPTTKLKLTPQARAMLTAGVDLRGAKMRPWYERAE